MARPRKEGLDYFPLTTRFDREIRAVRLAHGNDALAVWIGILQECYRTGKSEISVSSPLVLAELADDARVSIEQWRVIVRAFVDLGVFSPVEYMEQNIIASHGVAKQLKEIESERERDRARKSKTEPKTNSPAENPHIPTIIPELPAETKKEKEKETVPKGTDIPASGTDLFGKENGFIATVEFEHKGKMEHLKTFEELLPPKVSPDERRWYREWVKKRRMKHGPKDAVDQAAAEYCIKVMLPPLVKDGFTLLDIFMAAATNGWKGFYPPKTHKPGQKPGGPDISGEAKYRQRQQEIRDERERATNRPAVPPTLTNLVQQATRNV